MKSRSRYLIGALAVSAIATTVLSSRLDGVTTSSWRPTASTRATGGTATLVDVRVTTATDDDASPQAQQDALRAPARRRVGATCTAPGAGTNAYTLAGNRVSGATTVHLNPAGSVVSGAASVVQAAFNAWKAADPNAPTMT
ncbi:MAG: hypothetical protein JO086_12625, partial [Acidimicrobiia bacterium]|nr:hypothetical protein [Acidimicrobiia bacterium]